MADTILSGDFTVHYNTVADGRRKSVVWTGTPTGTRTANELYSALANLMDNNTQMDDGSVMSPQTPTEYTIGIIDPSDTEPWFIPRETVEHITGGAIQTTGWTRTEGTDIGIVRIPLTAASWISSADLGRQVVAGEGDSGQILDCYIDPVTDAKYLWVRPDSAAAANSFADLGTHTLTITSGDGALGQAGAAETGESLFVNAYGLGIVEDNTHLYVYQASTRLTSVVGAAQGTEVLTAVTATITTNLFEKATHGLSIGDIVELHTLTTMTTPAAGVQYIVLTTGFTAGAFKLGTVAGGIGGTALTVDATGSCTVLHLLVPREADDWWTDGLFDVVFPVKEVDQPIDGGYVSIFARQYSKTYAHNIASLGSGGRNPIPIQTGDDRDNGTGTHTLNASSGVNLWVTGEVIYVGASQAAATKKGIVTNVGGTEADPDIEYYSIGNLTAFAASDAIKGDTNSATATVDSVAVKTAGPANSFGHTPLTITFAATTYDVNEDGANENYAVAINIGTLSGYTIAQAYEESKYLTRRGETGTTKTDGIEGEQYIGLDYRFTYSSFVTAAPSEGEVVTQAVSGATGTIVSVDPTNKIVALRNSRGVFVTNQNIVAPDNDAFSGTITPTRITPIAASPFGTFAGGTWFLAPGVVLKNVPLAENNNHQATDLTGTLMLAPTAITATVSNTRVDDSIAVFRLVSAGGAIDKDEYAATVQSTGAGTLVAGAAITADTPGKTTGGIARLVDFSAGVEYRLRYVSWTGSTFTLFTIDAGDTVDAGSNGLTGTLIDSGATFVTDVVKVGDLVRRSSDAAYAYVLSVDSETQITHTPLSAGATWATGDVYEIGTLPIDTTTSDDIWVPILDVHETVGTSGSPGSEAANLTYVANIPVLVRVRHAGDILPFETPGTVTISGMSVATIRTADTIHT